MFSSCIIHYIHDQNCCLLLDLNIFIFIFYLYQINLSSYFSLIFVHFYHIFKESLKYCTKIVLIFRYSCCNICILCVIKKSVKSFLKYPKILHLNSYFYVIMLPSLLCPFHCPPIAFHCCYQIHRRFAIIC